MLSLHEIDDLAKRYDINPEDVLMIAMNTYGARSEMNYPRARMLIRLRAKPDDPLRLGLPLACHGSPFEVRDNRILLGGDPVADVEFCEDDDALLGYFRKNGKILTFNSNARSGCTGCVFCPNSLEGASDPRLNVLDDLDTCFKMMEVEQGWADMAHLEEVNLVTGCFHEEPPALAHLKLVRDALELHGFGGHLGFLSSVIRTEPAMRWLVERVSPFHLVVTFECFTNRDAILKHSKADLRPEDIGPVLARAKAAGIETGFTYIVGLDPMDVAVEGLAGLRDHVTRFPNFQVFQAHNDFMRRFAAPGAEDVEFMLESRKRIERLFVDTDLRPQTWANYRPLWYWSFAGEDLSGERI